MGIRIMQLQFEAGKRETKIVDGYEMWLSARIVRRNTFGAAGDGIIISSLYTPEEKRNVTTVHGVNVRKLRDGFKEIILAGVDVKVEDRDVWINTRRSNQNHDDVVLIATIDK